jgi:hypothetical protein
MCFFFTCNLIVYVFFFTCNLIVYVVVPPWFHFTPSTCRFLSWSYCILGSSLPSLTYTFGNSFPHLIFSNESVFLKFNLYKLIYMYLCENLLDLEQTSSSLWIFLPVCLSHQYGNVEFYIDSHDWLSQLVPLYIQGRYKIVARIASDLYKINECIITSTGQISDSVLKCMQTLMTGVFA